MSSQTSSVASDAAAGVAASTQRDEPPLTERVRALLEDPETERDVLEALEQFGGPMLDEMFSRVQTIETKAISVLGWSTALLGFLLLRFRDSTGSLPRSESVLLVLSIVAGVIALLAGFVAARSRVWNWPTLAHWFCTQEFDRPRNLRIVHLTALLEAYEKHSLAIAVKAFALQCGEYALLAAGLLVAVALILGLS